MIEEISATKDAAGFPVVGWTERRGFGRERIECRIMKTAAGELYFVARGHVRSGQFEEGRPWSMLQGFAIKGAEELYQTNTEQAFRRHYANKGAALSALLRDDGRVLVAGFRVGAPVHLNCADASQAELERLHGILSEAFVHGSQIGMVAGWRCAPDDARIEVYDPARTAWPGETAKASRSEKVMAGVGNLAMGVLALGMAALLVYLVLMLLGIVRV